MTLAGWTPHGTSPRDRLGAAARPRRKGLPVAMDLAWSALVARPRLAQQVTCSMAMTAPSAWFQTGITSGVDSSSTWQR